MTARIVRTNETNRRRGNWLAVVLLIVLPIAALWPVCGDKFVPWDDNRTIYHNPSLNPVTAQSLRTWWTTSRMELYVPVTYTVWGMIALFAHRPELANDIAAISPFPFHAASLILHLLTVWVVYQLLLKLIGKVWPAVAGALLFGLHPVQVEAVAWASGLKDVLGGLLALLAVWQYLRAVEMHRSKQSARIGWRSYYAIAILVFVMAMLSKPNEMTAPLIAGILDVIVLRRSWRQAMRWLWPWFVLSFACLVVGHLVQPVPWASHNVAIYLRPLVAIASLGFYLRKLLWPTKLAFDYGLRPFLATQSPWLMADALVLIGIAIALRLAGKRARPLVAGALIFVAGLLPVLGFVTFEFQWYSTVADHYLYLPMFGIALMAAWAAARWNGRPMIAGSAVVLALLGVISYRQTRVWKDMQSLFTHVIEVNPASGEAYHLLAMRALEEGNLSRALTLSQQSITARPDDVWGYISSGLTLWRLQRRSQAVQAYQNALRIDGNSEAALEGLAGVWSEMNELPAAEPLQRHVVANNPTSADQHFKLGWILEHEGKIPDALAEYTVALQLDPQDDAARSARAALVHPTAK